MPLFIARRLAVAVSVAAVTAGYVVFAAHRQPHYVSDFDQLWHAARVLRVGGNPYRVIGPGLAIDLQFPLYYPLPAVLIAAPLSWLPIVAARVVWVALPAGLLCFLLTKHDYSRLPLFMSGAFLTSALNAQWSPLLMCAALLPALGFLAAGKPNIGVASIVSARDVRGVAVSVGGAAVLLVASLLVLPGWPLSWYTAVRGASHFRPYALHPIGWVMLLAALRWRRPEARMLLAFALVPHTASPYEGVWAFLVTATFRQALVMAILTHAVRLVIQLFMRDRGFVAYVHASAWAMLLCVYLPCLFLVLRRPASSPQRDELDERRGVRVVDLG